MIRYILNLLFPASSNEAIVAALSKHELHALCQKRTVSDVTTILPYRHHKIRALMWRAKYADDAKAITLLAECLVDLIPQQSTVVPIPLHPARLRERGYNQVERIAHALAHVRRDVTIQNDLLLRSKNTPRQTHLRRKERLANVRGAFSVLSGVTVTAPLVLIDDIVTTGATLHEAKQTLTDAGHRVTGCIALAH